MATSSTAQKWLATKSFGAELRKPRIGFDALDWTSGEFWIGLVLGIAGAISVGALREAGKDLYRVVKNRAIPEERDPVQVRFNFCPDGYTHDDLIWVNEIEADLRVSEGYRYFIGPNDRAKRFHISDPTLPNSKRVFLMIRPGVDDH